MHIHTNAYINNTAEGTEEKQKEKEGNNKKV